MPQSSPAMPPVSANGHSKPHDEAQPDAALPSPLTDEVAEPMLPIPPLTDPDSANALNELGEKIFLDRYALKDMTKATLAVGDTVVVCVDLKTGQREIGRVKAMNGDTVTALLRDGAIVERLKENLDKPLELRPEQMMERVARGIARIEGSNSEEWYGRFRWLLDGWKFIPGGRILTAAGSDQQLTYYNCYVVPSPKDSRRGITDTLTQMMEIMSRGGGVGINIGSLRPKHAYVRGVNGRSSGSVSWGALYSFVTGLIEQGGSRRGALMLIQNCWHPDVMEFIQSKKEMGKITNANISVGITDDFMAAVEKDADWDLVFPDVNDPDYDALWDGDLAKWQGFGKKIIRYKTVKAREMWHAITDSAWQSAEPGVFFVERYNKMSNSWYFAPIQCTNPCVTGATLVSTEHGYLPAREMQVGMKIRTPLGLRPIEKVFNNGVQRIWRVEFSDGGHLDATADHKLKVVRGKKYEWVAVSDLQTGDKTLVAPNEAFGEGRDLPQSAQEYIARRDLKLGVRFDHTFGFLMGVVLGDGCFRKMQNGSSHSYLCRVAFGAHETEWRALFTEKLRQIGIHTHYVETTKEFVGEDGQTVSHASGSLECYKLATLMAKLGMEPNVKSPQKQVPQELFGLDRGFLSGILDGLFSTDGSVLMKQDNPMLRFHTASKALADQVRLLLLQFGIQARIYKQAREEGLTYDGRSMMGTGTKYDVVIMNEGIARFHQSIGLTHPEKSKRLATVAEEWHYQGGSWTAAVTSVTDTGREEEVFDVYEPESLIWVTNGYVSLDCGEQGLPAWGVCNLGALNLGKFVTPGRIGECEVDWDSLGQAVRYAVRFLDDVIDSTPYFFDENRRQQSNERRVGLGVMGLADMLIRLGHRYGDERSVTFLDELFAFIAREAYLASSDNAAEKGAFPKFDAEKLLQSGFMRGMPDEVREAVREKGLRNVTLLTVAPTGTTGTMVGTSTGVEPFFFWSYMRKSRLGVHEENVAVLREYREQAGADAPMPGFFTTAMDMTPEEHVRAQAAVQRWIDSSISKTCNVPNEYSVEQTRELYELMYRTGCKGGTIYRDGSRDTQVLNLKEEEKQPEAAPAPAPVQKVRPRPYKRYGVTVSQPSPSGTAHITMNDDADGRPFEVFVDIGKGGSDIKAMAEAMGRLMSLLLRISSPLSPKDRIQEIIGQIKGIGGARSLGFGRNRVRSLPDAVALALEEHYSLHREDAGPADAETPDGDAVAETLGGGASGMTGGRHIIADLCPSCGEGSFIRKEGCHTCESCGFSEC